MWKRKLISSIRHNNENELTLEDEDEKQEIIKAYSSLVRSRLTSVTSDSKKRLS